MSTQARFTLWSHDVVISHEEVGRFTRRRRLHSLCRPRGRHRSGQLHSSNDRIERRSASAFPRLSRRGAIPASRGAPPCSCPLAAGLQFGPGCLRTGAGGSFVVPSNFPSHGSARVVISVVRRSWLELASPEEATRSLVSAGTGRSLPRVMESVLAPHVRPSFPLTTLKPSDAFSPEHVSRALVDG